MTKKQCPLGEDCDLELVCSCSLTTAWMAGAAKAQDQIKAQAAEIERLRGALKKAEAQSLVLESVARGPIEGERMIIWIKYHMKEARTALAELTGAQKDGN